MSDETPREPEGAPPEEEASQAETAEQPPEDTHARDYSAIPARDLVRAGFLERLEELSPMRVVPVYVWDLVVRITHWTIALTLVILAATGFYIGNPFIVVPGEAGDHFVMGTVKAVHLYAAIFFGLAVVSRILWMFLGPYTVRWHRFVPVQKVRFQKLWGTFKYYVFAQRKPPAVLGHNPLAGLAYLAVFTLELVMVVTGLAMYSASYPEAWISFQWLIPLVGGLATARWVHHVVMWLLLGFVAHHVYSAVLVTVQERQATVESMVSGWKFLDRHDLEAAAVPLEKLVVLKGSGERSRGGKAA